MNDIVKKRYAENLAANASFRREFGAELNRAVPLFEDPTRYPIRELTELFMCQQALRENADAPRDVKDRLKREFAAKRDAIRLLPDAPERIYLWEQGNMPQETVYTDNPDHIYDHEPDFRPYYLEMLLPEGRQPVGAVVLVAGGTHGAGTLNECYRIALEFNELGYHSFILQCRPHLGPWSRLDTASDAARAIRMIRAKAQSYCLKPGCIAYAGFSNGGVTGDACIEFYSEGQHTEQYYPDYIPDDADAFSGGPDAFLCVYGARHIGTSLTRDNFAYPPTFFAVGRKDSVCIDNLYQNMLPWLLQRNVPVEVHTFAGHPHGYAGWKIINGKGDPNFDLWVSHADVFLRDLFVGYDPDLHG